MASFKIDSRVRETFLTAGTGPITTLGPVANCRGFGFMSTGDIAWYAAVKGNQSEEGIQTWTAPNIVNRTVIKRNSNNDTNPVDFLPGQGEIILDVPPWVLDALNLGEITVNSAATCDIGSVQGKYVAINGTTGPITSFGSAPDKERIVRHSGSTIVHDATWLILKGGINRVTKPNDIGVYKSDASGHWREISYHPASRENTLGNSGNPVTANYAIVADDAGKIIKCNTGSPNALYTLTLPSVSGFSGETVVTVVNNDAARGKLLSGFPADVWPCLYPKQVLQLRIVDGAWVTSVNPGPWRPQAGVTLNVDPVAGVAPSLTDGLGTGAGAINTIYNAYLIFQTRIALPAGFNPAIQLPAGGGTSSTSLLIANSVTRVFTTQANLGYSGARARAASAANMANFMEGVCTYSGTTLTMTVDKIGGSGTKSDWVLSYVFNETPASQILGAVPSGTGVVEIFGNETTPTAVRWNSDGLVVCDGAILALRGFHVGTVSNGKTFLTVDKQGLVVFQNMSWGSAVAGVHVSVKSGGNFVWDGGSYRIGDAATAPNCFDTHILNNGGDVNIQQTGQAISVPYALTFSAFYNGIYPGSRGFFDGSTFTGTGSGSGSTGFKYAAQAGASIFLNGAVLPGATAGFSSNGGLVDAIVTPPVLSKLSSALGADVLLNNTGNFFDGPSVAQGSTGTWFVTATVELIDTGVGAQMFCKIWDGTTIIASGIVNTPAANLGWSITLSGCITSPAGNLKISCKDATATTGKISAAGAGGNTSTITALRIA